MIIPEVLDSTAAYLRQLREAAKQDDDPIEISETLIQDIDATSVNVNVELASKFSCYE